MYIKKIDFKENLLADFVKSSNEMFWFKSKRFI